MARTENGAREGRDKGAGMGDEGRKEREKEERKKEREREGGLGIRRPAHCGTK